MPGSSPSAYSTLAKVRRSECGVIRSGSGENFRLARLALAHSTATLSTRERRLLGFCRPPLSVENTYPLGRRLRCRARSARSSSLSAPRSLTRRLPASVLDSPTCSHPAARSTSRQPSAHSSPIRRPANVSVASIARRSTCRQAAYASRSSSPAAPSSASICKPTPGRGPLVSGRRVNPRQLGQGVGTSIGRSMRLDAPLAGRPLHAPRRPQRPAAAPSRGRAFDMRALRARQDTRGRRANGG